MGSPGLRADCSRANSRRFCAAVVPGTSARIQHSSARVVEDVGAFQRSVIILNFNGPLVGEHLVEHRAKREQVGARIDCLTAYLLRRHVAGRAQDRAWVGRCSGGGISACRDRLGQAEVENLDLTIREEKDVGWLEIAMDDAFGVSGR